MTFSALTILAASATFPYPSVTPSEFQSGAFDGKRVQMTATVVDGFVDELDSRYVFFVLRNSGEDVYAFMQRKFFNNPPESLVGAEVQVWGSPHLPIPTHLYAQRQFTIPNSDALVVTRPAPDPFAAPGLDVKTSHRRQGKHCPHIANSATTGLSDPRQSAVQARLTGAPVSST